MKRALALYLVLYVSVAPALAGSAGNVVLKESGDERILENGAPSEAAIDSKDVIANPGAAIKLAMTFTEPKYDAQGQMDPVRQRQAAANVAAVQKAKRKFPIWATIAIVGCGIAGSAVLINRASRPAASPSPGVALRVEGQP